MRRNSSMERLFALPNSSSSESDVEEEEEEEEEEAVVVEEVPPPTWGTPGVGTTNRKRLLSKQLSMRETTREAKWEKRRRQILQRRHSMITECGGIIEEDAVAAAAVAAKAAGLVDVTEEGCESARRRRRVRSLTDEDLDELRGSIELGFGFNEEDGGQNLRDTLPALDLYFAVNRQLSDPKLRFSPSPVSTPTPTSSASTICGTPSPRSPSGQQSSPTDHWKICNPGDNPQHVKTRLRHWAQAVACSVRQCC